MNMLKLGSNPPYTHYTSRPQTPTNKSHSSSDLINVDLELEVEIEDENNLDVALNFRNSKKDESNSSTNSARSKESIEKNSSLRSRTAIAIDDMDFIEQALQPLSADRLHESVTEDDKLILRAINHLLTDTCCNEPFPQYKRKIIENAVKGKYLLQLTIFNSKNKTVYLNGVNLSGLNLCGLNLSEASLVGANLQHTILLNADLSGADLSHADLTHTNLINANLSNAVMDRTTLNFTNLTDANLDGVNLLSATITNTRLQRAKTNGACLPLPAEMVQHHLARQPMLPARSTADNARILEAIKKLLVSDQTDPETLQLKRQILENAKKYGYVKEITDLFNIKNRINLTKVDLSGLDLSGVDFSGAILIEANLSRTNLTGADLTAADLNNAQLNGTILTDTIISKTLLAHHYARQPLDVWSGKSTLSQEKIIHEILSSPATDSETLKTKKIIIENASRLHYLGDKRLFGSGKVINLTRVDLSQLNLDGAKLAGAILTEANLMHSTLNDADLREADLSGADLTATTLTNTDLTNAKCAYTILLDVDLETIKGNIAKIIQEAIIPVNIIDPISTEALACMPLLQRRHGGDNNMISDAIKHIIKLESTNDHILKIKRRIIENASRFGYLNDSIESLEFLGNPREINLANVDLSGLDLSGANLAGANLTSANLSNAKLRMANLSGANLTGANFELAELNMTSLNAADLTNTNFSRAYLIAITIKDAVLANTHFDGAFLFKINFSKRELNTTTSLAGTVFLKSDLSRANMRDMNLRSCWFIGAKLILTDMAGANLNRAKFDNSDLRGAQLINASQKDTVMFETTNKNYYHHDEVATVEHRKTRSQLYAQSAKELFTEKWKKICKKHALDSNALYTAWLEKINPPLPPQPKSTHQTYQAEPVTISAEQGWLNSTEYQAWLGSSHYQNCLHTLEFEKTMSNLAERE